MGKLIFVSGGARSGKSAFAEELIQNRGGVLVAYVATAQIFDHEMRERVRKHRQRRPENWETLERWSGFESPDVIEILRKKTGCLLDCLTIMVTNCMFRECEDPASLSEDEKNELETRVLGEVRQMIDALKEVSGISVIVTNELGMGVVPENALARFFRDIAGKANQLAAGSADEAWVVISGIPLRLKG